ncbi:hypothetical protein [Streptomyces sp. NPDC093094]|uniref:hypothetical protein n=1 Tax=Streptomyces sp. NPDC093094 TaxID=3366026 RepID=UPI00381CADAE
MGRLLVGGVHGTLLLYQPDPHAPELLKISRTTAPARPPQPQEETAARRTVTHAVTAALPGAHADEQTHQTLITPHTDADPAAEPVSAVIGPWGDWMQLDTPRRPGQTTVAVLAAFTHARTPDPGAAPGSAALRGTTGSVRIPGDVAGAFTRAFTGTVTADVAPRLGCAETDALAALLHALGAENTAREWTDTHAEDDEPGERHFTGTIPDSASLAADQTRWTPHPAPEG